MELLTAFLLALIQGVSEFLPVSSSAHLILASYLLKGETHPVLFDLVVHLGTLVAVFFYFHSRLANLLSVALLGGGRRRGKVARSLFCNLIIATLPIIGIAYLVGEAFFLELRSIAIIAHATLWFGLLLCYAVLKSKRHKEVNTILNWKVAIVIGCAQVFALVPGASRSGVVITASLLLGVQPKKAIDFAFLLAIPTIGIASLWQLIQAILFKNSVPWDALLVGFTVATIFSYLTIRGFLRLVKVVGLLPFVGYRILLAAVLFGLFVY